jgi:hypothetical protein
MAEPYTDALKKAQRELAECNAAADELERKRARLRQTVAVLQSLMGIEARLDQSLTDAILMAVKASLGYVTAAQVVDLLVEMGYQVQPASVATILSRLTKNSKIIHAVGPNAQTGYAWRRDTTQTERISAKRDLATKAGKAS